MKVLLALHHLADPDTGAEGTTMRLGSALEALGCEVRYGFYDDVFGSRVQNRATLLKYPWALAGFIHRLNRDWRPDIVDAGTGDAWVALRYRRRSETVFVTRSHGLEPLYYRELSKSPEQGRLSLMSRAYSGGYRLWEVARSLKNSDHVIVPNHAETAFVTDRYGVSPDRISTLAYPISGVFFANEAVAKQPPAKVISVGAMKAMKGGGDLIAAIKEMAARDFTLTLAGCTPGFAGEEELRRLLGPRLQIIPKIANEEIASTLAAHSIFVCASRYEGGPLSVVEAAASGLAIVATTVGNIPERFTDGVNAMLVPPRRPSLLAQSLDRLIDDVPAQNSLAVKARDVAEPFRPEVAARATLDLYERLLAARSPGKK